MRYQRLTSLADLNGVMDFIIDGLHQMVSKTGAYGQTAEEMLGLLCKAVRSPDGYVLVGFDSVDQPVGFLFAHKVPSAEPWINFVALYTKPGVAMVVKEEVCRMLEEWVTSIGVKRILTVITRAPEVFYERFHKPLGFRKVGLLLERTLP